MTTPTRERDFDLLRLILLEIESFPPTNYMQSYIGNESFDIEDYDSAVVVNHIEMLIQAGFIDAEITNSRRGSFIIREILWEGHEFLDNAKNDTIWKKFKARAESKGSSMSMTVANGLLTALGKKYIGLD